jgi:hypothetical protein
VSADVLHIGRDLTLPLDAVTRAWAIVGQRGTGKTSTAVVVVEEAAQAGAQVAVIDPTGAWYGLRTSASGKGAGLKVVVFGGHNGDLPLEHTAGAFLARLVIEQHLNVVLDLERMTKGQQVQFVAEFAETLYHENRTALTLVMDEAHRFAPQMLRDPGGYGARCLGAVTDVVTLGRRKGLGAVLISQRPAKINKDVFEQAEVMIVHRLLGPNDRKAIAGWLDEVGESPDVMMREVPRLAPRTVIVYAPHYDVHGIVEIRKKRTFDSSATPEVGAAKVEPKGRADVDLAAIREAMAETIAEVEANDPKKLRARILELTRELAGKDGQDTEILREARETVEALRVALQEAMDRADVNAKRADALEAYIGPILSAVDGLRELYADVPKKSAAAPAPAREARPLRLVKAAPPTSQGGGTPKTVVQGRPESEARAEAVAEFRADLADKPLLAGARRMVEAVAAYHPQPLTRKQMAALAQMKPTSGTFRNYMGDIRRAGYLRETDGRLHMTEAGWVAIGGADAAHEPMTPQQVRDLWSTKLLLGARRMLDALIEQYPGWYSRSELAAVVDMSPTSGTYRNYLGNLRTAALIEEDGSTLRAGDVLFLGVTNGRQT